MVLDTRGFGLPATILVLIVFTALGLFGVALARQETRTHVRTTSRASAFYAAETGLARAMENWNRPDVIDAGDSWIVDQGTLPGGGFYQTTATQLDDGNTVNAIYSIEAVGTARDGRSRSVGLLVATMPDDNPVKAALKAKGDVKVVGQAGVNGWDEVPTDWGGFCPPSDGGLPGAMVTGSDTKNGGGHIDGDPDVQQVSDTTGWYNFGELGFEDVANRADHNFVGNTNISGSLAPSLNADGTCNTSDQFNWGDPETLGQPCSEWFPLIHVDGDFTGSGSDVAQGLLVVNGDVSLCGGFTFYGVIVAKGQVKACGSGFKIFGGIVAGDVDLNNQGSSKVVGKAEVQYSACVVDRVLSRTKAAKPHPLLERPWYSTR